MSNPLVVSRRRAAMFIAGAFAGSAGPAAAATAFNSRTLNAGEVPENDHRRIAMLLQSVRRAGGLPDRARAFDRCKAALRDHDRREAAIIAHTGGPRAATQALYRHTDPSTVLANVIVRELDAWPKNEDGWLQRFGDLEAAFLTHVATEHLPG